MRQIPANKSNLLFLLFFLFFFLYPHAVHADPVSARQPWIRVAVASGKTSVTVTTSGPSDIHVLTQRDSISSNSSGANYSFTLDGDSVRYGNVSADGFSVVLTGESGSVRVDGKSYRRMMRVLIWEGRIACVNVLPLEEYLWGVISAEMPNTWHMEALRAQAVAARTYSLRALESHPERPFDVYADVVDQVYNGISAERETTTRACIETAGLVCTFNRTPIIAYFHAASGGCTASGADAFGRDLSYLRSVPSMDGSVLPWNYSIAPSAVASKLNNNGYITGSVRRIYISRFSPEGRPVEVTVIHSEGRHNLPVTEFRKILGYNSIRSTSFTPQGQSFPETYNTTQIISVPEPAGNNQETFLILNQSLIIPHVIHAELESCAFISSASIADFSTLNSIYVIGSEGICQYTNGSIFVAVSGSSGEINASDNNPENLPASGYSDRIQSGFFVDDSDGFGYPVNGTFTFSGHGAGHGVGMSQHGARILAEQGWSYQQILRHFYSGIEIEPFW